MEKSILERFISKYNLSGAAESVLWTIDKKSLATRFRSDDKNILGVVSTDGAGIDPGEYGIYDTAQLSSMLKTLDDEIQVTVNERNNRPVSLVLNDPATRAEFMLSDPTIILDVPDLKQIPEWDIVVELDSSVMTTFVRGKNALPDVETFTILTDDDGETRIVLGYSENNNTNRISFKVNLVEGSGLDRPISFSARYMKEVLLANKESESARLSVSNKGLAHVTFNVDGFSVDYYLVEIQVA